MLSSIKHTLQKNKRAFPVKQLVGIYVRLINLGHIVKIFFKMFRMYLYNGWLTYFPSNTIRLFYLRHCMGIKIGRRSFIHMGCLFEGAVNIGNHSIIGRKCTLKGNITIKDNVSITAETYIFTSSHIVNDPDFNCFYKTVIIEDYVWIGARAMIMPGITIGKGAVLASASTATKDIPDYHIYAGTPARSIGVRSSDLRYTLDYRPFFQ